MWGFQRMYSGWGNHAIRSNASAFLLFIIIVMICVCICALAIVCWPCSHTELNSCTLSCQIWQPSPCVSISMTRRESVLLYYYFNNLFCAINTIADTHSLRTAAGEVRLSLIYCCCRCAVWCDVVWCDVVRCNSVRCGCGRVYLGPKPIWPTGTKDLRSRRVAASRFALCIVWQAGKKRCYNKCAFIYLPSVYGL